MHIVTSCRRLSYTFEGPVLQFWILYAFAVRSRLLLQSSLGLFWWTATACEMHGWIMMVTAVGPLRVCLGGWLQPWPIGTFLDPGPACPYGLMAIVDTLVTFWSYVFFDFFFLLINS